MCLWTFKWPNQFPYYHCWSYACQTGVLAGVCTLSGPNTEGSQLFLWPALVKPIPDSAVDSLVKPRINELESRQKTRATWKWVQNRKRRILTIIVEGLIVVNLLNKINGLLLLHAPNNPVPGTRQKLVTLIISVHKLSIASITIHICCKLHISHY